MSKFLKRRARLGVEADLVHLVEVGEGTLASRRRVYEDDLPGEFDLGKFKKLLFGNT